MKCLLVLFLLLMAFPVAAETPTNGGLGRLFFTPEMRATLDVRRTQDARAGNSDPGNPVVRLDGIVQRADGTNMVWLNGQASRAHPSVAVRSEHSARVHLADGRHIDLLVGETFDPARAATEPRQ